MLDDLSASSERLPLACFWLRDSFRIALRSAAAVAAAWLPWPLEVNACTRAGSDSGDDGGGATFCSKTRVMASCAFKTHQPQIRLQWHLRSSGPVAQAKSLRPRCPSLPMAEKD